MKKKNKFRLLLTVSKLIEIISKNSFTKSKQLLVQICYKNGINYGIKEFNDNIFDKISAFDNKTRISKILIIKK